MKCWKDTLAPAVVLVAICLISTVLLGFTYDKTEPIIDELAQERATQARKAVLPEGDTFVSMDVEQIDGVTQVYLAENMVGVVITTSTKGFGGAVEVMTAIDKNGVVVGVQVIAADNETPGVGSKATTEAHLTQFVENTDLTQVDGVAGATYTSKAVYNGVAIALAQFAEMGGIVRG